MRVPAEWEDYSTVMIAWPHADTDWASMLDEVTECYVRLSRAIVESGVRLLVVTPSINTVLPYLKDLPEERLLLFEAPTNDTWTRDYGPITLEAHDGVYALDFQFNGWGLKFAANHDNLVTLRMLEASVLTHGCYRPKLDFVFEGGSMEVDGHGTMLTTSSCLLSLNRNGMVTKDSLRDYFKETMGVSCIHFLEHGHLSGDDTDSHIDTLARFAPHDTILYVKSYNPADEHTAGLDLMEAELKAFRNSDGMPYNLIALPLPDPVFDGDGCRLPATYANFLVTPKTVLLPTYKQPDNDLLAKQMIEIAYPDREVIPVDCTALIRQHGSLHCATMQLPAALMGIG